MRRSIVLALFVLAAALVHFACDDTTTAPLPGGSSTGNQPGGSTGGTNPGPGSGGTQPGNTGGSTASGGMSPENCGTMSPTGTISDRYGAAIVTRNGLQYYVQNNVWGASANQSLVVNGTSFTVTQQTGDNSGSYNPVSYPSIFIGSNNSHATANSGLPRAVTSLPSITTSFSHNATGSIGGIYNAAYDVWFSTTASGDPGNPSGGYLMVWLYRPTQKQPVGGVRAAGQTIAGADGTWNVYTCTPTATDTCSNNRPVISYVRTTSTTSLTFDLRNFINHAMSNFPANVPTSWYLSNIFAGFEIWSGGVGLQVSCFWIGMG